MRVISQDGTVDFPYEKAVLYAEYESVIAKVGEERCVVGIYSTEEKAIKVMEMLREVYRFYNDADNGIFCFPQDNEIEV